MGKKCMTISGGFDSGCLPFLFEERVNEYDFIFFNYNQLYLVKEKEKAQFLADHFHKELIVIEMNLVHDQERRNFLFLSKLKELKYSEVIMGNRGLLPLFDQYKDSNFVSLKLFSSLLHLDVKLPVVGWTKKRVLSFLKEKKYLDFYNCYLNNSDMSECDCPNCKELQILKRKGFL
jgi:hypothetical protein